MKIRARGFRGAVSAPVAAFMLTLSVGVPVMERADVGRDPVLESEHDPAACPPAHDHTICTQVGANQAVPVASAPHRPGHLVLRHPEPAIANLGDASPYTRGPPSRAPPSA